VPEIERPQTTKQLLMWVFEQGQKKKREEFEAKNKEILERE